VIQSAVAHQLTGILESAQRTGFGHDRHRRYLSDGAQSLQGGDHGTDLFGRRGNGLVHRLLQSGDPLAAGMLTSAMLVLLGVFARPHQIAQRFVGCIGNPDPARSGLCPFSLFRFPARTPMSIYLALAPPRL
jgi:hypothetical protein